MRLARVSALMCVTPFVMAAQPASAQDTTLLCRADARTFCRSESMTKNRETIHVCLERNVDQISRDCRTLIRMTSRPPAERRPAS